MSEKLKSVNVDIQSFSDFKEKDCYYVDKTSYIKDILLNSGTTVLFTRPRRFGKSITLSMLKSFLEMNYENPSDKSKQIELFKDTEIFKDKEFCDKYMGQFPIIYLSFKESRDAQSYEYVIDRIYELLGSYVQKYYFLLNSDKLTPNQLQNLQNILTINNNDLPPSRKESVVLSSILELTQDLYAHTGKKCIVLIDEYDVPLSKVAHRDFYQDIRELVSNLFNTGLKNNEALEKGIITGCLRVAKESIFTGLNNFQSFGLENSRFSSLFGFTQNEVKTMLSYYKLDDKYPEYQEWYDGYHIGDDDIFCPWDVISRTDDLLSKKMNPESYWGGTGNIELVSQMFAKDPESYAEDLQNLLDGKSVTVTLSKDINYEILGGSEDSNHFWSFLFSSGYLTIAKNTEYKSIGDDSKEATVSLVVPNNSVKEELKKAIKWCFTVKNPEYAKSLKTLIWALKEDKAILLQRYFNNTLASYVSVYDTQKGTDKESMYHAFLNGRFSSVFASSKYKYASNAEYGNGRPDFTFLLPLGDSLDSPTVGFIIEIKSAQNEDEMESLAQAALKQAKDKKYAEGMIRKLHDEIDEVKVYGIAFYKKTCKVVFERISNQES